MQLVLKIIYGIFITLIIIIAPAGNGCLLFAILSTKKHRKIVSNIYLVTLAITDLLGGIINGSYFLMSLNLPEYNENLKEKYLIPCKAGNFFIYAIGINRILALTLMSVDRYLAILHPFLYQRIVSRRGAVAMSIFITIQSCATNLPMSLIPGWVNYDGKPGAPCGFMWDGKLSYLTPYAILNFGIPVIVLLVSNATVFVIARNQRRRILLLQLNKPCGKKKGIFGMPSSLTQFPATANESPVEKDSEMDQCDGENHSQNTLNMRKAKLGFSSNSPERLSKHDDSAFDGRDHSKENFYNIAEQGEVFDDNFQLAKRPQFSNKEHLNGTKHENCSLPNHDVSAVSVESVQSQCCIKHTSLSSNNAWLVKNIEKTEPSKDEICSNAKKYGTKNSRDVSRNKKEEHALDVKNEMGKTGMPTIRAQEIIITFSTIVIVILFLISWSPFVFARIAFVADRRLFSWHVVVWTTALTLISSAGNPLIVLGTRRDLRGTIKKRCKVGEQS